MEQAIKVLFISSGNSNAGINPVVHNQGESLKNYGVILEYFPIEGKGLLGYFKNIPLLRSYIKKNNFDILHAHYSFSALIATMVSRKK